MAPVRLGDQEGQVPRGQVAEPPPPVRGGRRDLLERRHAGRDVVGEDRGDLSGIRRDRRADDWLWFGGITPRSVVAPRSAFSRLAGPRQSITPGTRRIDAGHRGIVDRIFDIGGAAGVRCTHGGHAADVSRARYESRPGRRAVVAASLADLRGPAEGTVELPIWLFWSSPDHTFDLGDQDMRRWLYQTVLREAGRPEDLTAYLDGDTLIALWPDLYLPKGVRQAWEEQHPVLRAAAAARRLMPVSEFHGQVAAIALRAAAPHGFALGGGNALIAHGVIDRFTQDVDVFSDEEGGVEAAAEAVEAALRAAGFGTERRDKAGGLGDIFYGLGEGWPSGSSPRRAGSR